MLNLPPAPVDDVLRLAREDRIDTFIFMADDPRQIQSLAVVAEEARAAWREEAGPPRGAAARGDGSRRDGRERREAPPRGRAPATTPRGDARHGLGITPTPDDGVRRSAQMPWDESTRPHHAPDPDADYTDRGRAAGKHLIDVHDMLRKELDELRDLVDQVREGALSAGDARSMLERDGAAPERLDARRVLLALLPRAWPRTTRSRTTRSSPTSGATPAWSR